MSSTQASALAGEFSRIVGSDNVMTSENDRYAYSYDAAVLDSVMPGLVVRELDRGLRQHLSQEVSKALEIKKAKLVGQSVAIGAALMALDEFA